MSSAASCTSPRAHGLQFLAGRRFGIARLFHGLIQLLLPLLGAAVFAEQLREFLLAGLLLLGEGGELLSGGFQLLDAGQLAILFFLQRLLALLLFAEFIALLIELLQALGDLPVELHEGRSRFIAQGLQRFGREQGAERCQLFVQTLAITAQLTLLIGQVLGRLLARRFGADAVAVAGARHPVAG